MTTATTTPLSPSTAFASVIDVDNEPSLFIEDNYFSMVPEWVTCSTLPDSAVRVYLLLLRYGDTSGVRMPSRQTLARRLHRSTDTIDRGLRALELAGVVVVQRRRRDGVYLPSSYHVRTRRPRPETRDDAALGSPDSGGGGGLGVHPAHGGSRRSAATPIGASTVDDVGSVPTTRSASETTERGSRRSAPTPGRSGPIGQSEAGEEVSSGGGRKSAATGRTSAAGVAANLRPNPEVLTQRKPPPPTSSATRPVGGAAREEEVNVALTDCGLADCQALLALAARCAAARTALGQPATRWAAPCIAAALQLAVRGRGWPVHLAVPALLAVAADPATRSPMRLAEAGPWWDQPVVPAASDPAEAAELAHLEARLDDLDGGRLRLQAAARAELTHEGLPLTRSTVVRRACAILDRSTATAGVR